MKKFKKPHLEKHNNVKFQSISISILKRNIITMVLTILITSVLTSAYIANLITDISKKSNISSSNILEKEIDSIKSSQVVYLGELYTNNNIINIAKNKNSVDLNTMLNNVQEFNITVTDTNGKVIASTQSTLKAGDNISKDLWIKDALQGKVISDIGKGSSGFYSINTGSPIYSGSTLVGVISAEFNLENADFIDNMKSITKSEITIFEKDESINTTIIQDGKRLVGTKLDSNIADKVINNKQGFVGKTNILEKAFITTYKPQIASDGTVTGVLFTGSDFSEIQKQLYILQIINTVISIVAIILSIFILNRFITNNLKKPLSSVVNAAREIETGEIELETLNQLKSISSNNEIGSLARSMEGAVNSINLLEGSIDGFKEAMLNNDLTYTIDSTKHKGAYLTIIQIVEGLFKDLRLIILEINQAADGIDSGAEHVSTAAQMLAQGATEQASSTEELAATISDISEQIKGNAESAIESSNLSNETGKVVLQGSKYMSDLMNAMEEISQSSNKIEKIIKSIDDIAFQTNILALNAAVEAARAGSAGKGFAVVADEVKNLASKSADAAKSTTILIEDSISAIQKGSTIAKETEEALKNVVEKTNKANLLINDISEASQRQSDNIYQINIGVDQISSVVQSNSATAEQIAAASEELSGQANSLKEMVDKYIL